MNFDLRVLSWVTTSQHRIPGKQSRVCHALVPREAHVKSVQTGSAALARMFAYSARFAISRRRTLILNRERDNVRPRSHGDELFAIEHIGHRRRFPGLIGLKPPQWVPVGRIHRHQASALLAKNHQSAGSGERAAPRVGGSWLRQGPSNVAREDIYRFQNSLWLGFRCSTLRPAQVSLPGLPISRIALCVKAAFFKG